LRYLGLADTSENRKRIVSGYKRSIHTKALNGLIQLLTYPRFHPIDFKFVAEHISDFQELTYEKLKEAVLKTKEETPSSEYSAPYLDNIIEYLKEKALENGEIFDDDLSWITDLGPITSAQDHNKRMESENATTATTGEEEGDGDGAPNDSLPTHDLRLVFIDLVRSAYNFQIEKGYLDGRDGFLPLVLLQSLDFAMDHAHQDIPLDDWKAAQLMNKGFHVVQKRLKHFCRRFFSSLSPMKKKHSRSTMMTIHRSSASTNDFIRIKSDVHRAVCFIDAHKWAQTQFAKEFCGSRGIEFLQAEQVIVNESQGEVEKAAAVLAKHNKDDVEIVLSHLVCMILLNKRASFIESFAQKGLMKEQEASEYIEEVEGIMEELRTTNMREHKRQG